MEFQDFQSLFQRDIRLVKINSLLKFDDCWEQCLGRLHIYGGTLFSPDSAVYFESKTGLKRINKLFVSLLLTVTIY